MEWGQFLNAGNKQHCFGLVKVLGEANGCVMWVVKIRKEEIAFDFDLFFFGQMGRTGLRCNVVLR